MKDRQKYSIFELRSNSKQEDKTLPIKLTSNNNMFFPELAFEERKAQGQKKTLPNANIQKHMKQFQVR